MKCNFTTQNTKILRVFYDFKNITSSKLNTSGSMNEVASSNRDEALLLRSFICFLAILPRDHTPP